MRIIAYLFLCLTTQSGCRTRLLDEPSDGITPVDGGSPSRDLTPDLPSDLGASDAAPCEHEQYGVVLLSRIELIDPAGAHHLGAVIRLKLVFPMGACDYVATTGQHVTIGNATDGVELTTYLWRTVGGGPDCSRMVEGSRVVDVDGAQLSNLRLFARDAAPGGTAALQVQVGPRPAGACNPTRAIGQPCQLDCQCAQPNGVHIQCIPTAPSQGICARMCAEDSECTPTLPVCDTAATPAYTCTAARPGGCPHDCAFGTSCTDGVCRPAARPPASKCHCNADCPGAQYCDLTGVCFAPCFTVSACPAAANYCGYGKCGFP